MTFQKVLNYCQYLLFIPITIVLATFPFIAFGCFSVYLAVYLLSCLFPNYGKFINYHDVWHDENLVKFSIPQNSLVISLTLQGDLSLEKLRFIFTQNVLNARSTDNPQKLRYPELQQYLTTFICFRIWKSDPSFLVENHIVEKSWDGTELANIHQECQNQPYEKHHHRSPSEIILIRNIICNEDTESGPVKTLLMFKVHHVMADAKSLLKLLVECLGNKPIKMATPHITQKPGFVRELHFLLNFPYNCIVESSKVLKLAYNSFHHPWKLQGGFFNQNYQESSTIVAFSPKMSVSTVKQVAKEKQVKTSAVVMSIIAGAIGKYCTNWNKGVAVGYALPKPKHPSEVLTNHAYSGIVCLPVHQKCSLKRVEECNKEFVRVKEEQLARYTNVGFFMGGIQIYPISRLVAVNAIIPIAITNIAGEEEGFSVVDAECLDFRMSAGTMPGAAGVLFCCMSYKDGMRIAVVAKESVLSKEIAESIASHIEFELQLLIKSC